MVISKEDKDIQINAMLLFGQIIFGITGSLHFDQNQMHEEHERMRKHAEHARTKSLHFRGMKEAFRDDIYKYRDFPEAVQRDIVERIAEADPRYAKFIQDELYPERKILENGSITSKKEFRIAKNALDVLEDEKQVAALARMMDDYEQSL